MNPNLHAGWSRQSLRAIACATALLLACENEPSSPPGPNFAAPAAARAASDVVVSSTSPDSATQDTTLDVTISGSGFASDAVASWGLAGVPDSTQVRTNSTRYVNARTLVANITISGKAAVGKWDVMVMSKGKGGIGTETFAIKLRPQIDPNSRAFITWESQINAAAPGAPVNMQPAGIAGDGRDSRGQPAASSQYQGAFCGVQGSIFWKAGPGESGDLVFDPDKDFSAKATCPKRTLNFYLGYQSGGARGTATPIGAFTNVRQVMQLGQGETRLQWMRFWYIGFRNCDGLSFESRLGISGVSDVKVTRLPNLPDGSGQWRVETQYPHLGMCTVFSSGAKSRGALYLPFALTVTEVPYPYPKFPELNHFIESQRALPETALFFCKKFTGDRSIQYHNPTVP